MNTIIVTIVLTAALCGFLFGFDEGVVSGAFPFMEKSFTFTPLTQGLMAASVPLGAFFGAIVAGALSDRLGRRRIIAASAILFSLGFVAIAVAPSVAAVSAARLAIGFAVGVSAVVAPQYLAEVAPPNIRGRVIGMFQLMIVVGILVSYLGDLALASIKNDWIDTQGIRWRLMYVVGLLPALILFVGIRKAPESPRWLAMQGNRDAARSVLASLQPDEGDKAIAGMIGEMSIDRAGETNATFSELFSPRLRHLTIFAMLAFILQQLSGINALIYYAPQIFEGLNFSSVSAQLTATVGIGVVNLLSTIFALVIVDHVGRRTLLMSGFAGATCMLGLIVVVMSNASSADDWLALIGIFGFIFFFATSIGPLPWIYMSELFPTHLRSVGLMLATCTNWLATFLIVVLFPVVAEALGMTATMGIFTVCCIGGFIATFALAPETRGIPLEEVADKLGK